MKKRVFFSLAILLCAGGLFAAGPDFSGVFDSTVTYTAGAGDSPSHSWGIEEYANVRLKFNIGEKAVFYSAFNLIAMAGTYLENAAFAESFNAGALVSTPIVYGQNFAAGLELERLYLRINGNFIDTELGLLRMNFGYGQVWGSSDFLNPRNPLFPNARPRGLLGVDASFYPADSLKLMGFVAAPKNPFTSGGGGFLPGVSLDQHWDRASIQALYAFETPQGGSEWGIHRFGFSLKADLEIGIVADLLYCFNPVENDGIEGLSASAGFDYSFFGGDLYVLFEYLFNGSSSSTALGSGGSFINHHFLYGNVMYRFNDYCSLALSTVFCFDDLSFSPFVTLNYEVFQGFSLNLSLRVPLDQKTFGGSRAGELGPVPPDQVLPDGTPYNAGAWVVVTAGAKLRF